MKEKLPIVYKVGKILWFWDQNDDSPRWFFSNYNGITSNVRITEDTIIAMGGKEMVLVEEEDFAKVEEVKLERIDETKN